MYQSCRFLLGYKVAIARNLGYMELIIYPLLNIRSKKAWLKTKKRWGHPKSYIPRPQLVYRLQITLNWTREEVLAQIEKERAWVLKYQKYFT